MRTYTQFVHNLFLQLASKKSYTQSYPQACMKLLSTILPPTTTIFVLGGLLRGFYSVLMEKKRQFLGYPNGLEKNGHSPTLLWGGQKPAFSLNPGSDYRVGESRGEVRKYAEKGVKFLPLALLKSIIVY